MPKGVVMDWQMIGAVGELLGALGVVVSLGYLASQIRSSNIASAHRAAGEILDTSQAFLGHLSDSPQKAGVWRRGLEADPELSVDELVQFRALVLAIVQMWERAYHMAKAGHLEGSFFHTIVQARKDIVRAPGFHLWLEGRGHWLTPEFLSVLERETNAGGAHRPGAIEAGDTPIGASSTRETA